MNKNRFSLLLLIGLSGCSQPASLTTEEVTAAINRFDAGWKSKNAAMVDSVLSPSYIYFTQSGGTFDRKNVVFTAGSPDYVLDTVTRRQVDIHLDGNTAVVNTIWTARGRYFEKPFNDTQRCSITLVKTKGKVMILSEHCTPVK